MQYYAENIESSSNDIVSEDIMQSNLIWRCIIIIVDVRDRKRIQENNFSFLSRNDQIQ